MTPPRLVVHVITKLELGGAQINTLYTWRHLDPNRFAAWLLCGPGGPLLEGAGRTRLTVLPQLGREIRPRRDLAALLAIRRELKRLRPALVHTHSSKAGILGRLAARLAGVPVVIHSVHGFSFSAHQPRGQRLLYRIAERLAAPLTDHFVFVADADRREALRLGLCKEDGASLIRSGFPQGPFRAPAGDDGARRLRFGVPPGRPVIGVVAPFKPQKGLFHLAAAAARIVRRRPDALFLVAGDGAQRPAFEAELARLGIAAHFRLPGFIADVEQAMALFDVGVSTALWEGLPQSLVQMRLMGKPLVVSAIPGNMEVVRDGRNGFVVPVGDGDACAARVVELLDDPALRARLGACPDDWSEWDAERMVRRQEELYERLLRQAGQIGLPGASG